MSLRSHWLGFRGVLVAPFLGLTVVIFNPKSHNEIFQLQLIALVLQVVLEISPRRWEFLHDSSNLKSFR